MNIEASVGESTPTEVEIGTPTYRSGCLVIDKGYTRLIRNPAMVTLQGIIGIGNKKSRTMRVSAVGTSSFGANYNILTCPRFLPIYCFKLHEKGRT